MKNKILAAFAELRKLFSSDHLSTIDSQEEIAALKRELQLLETQLGEADNERMELEKLLADFEHRYSMELGNLLLEILNLRKRLFQKDDPRYREAEKDERKYRQKVMADKKKQRQELDGDEQQALKKKFRMATFLCHPDKVGDDKKKAAQETFIRLKNAYDSNDLKQVEEILTNLEKGNFFQSKSDTVSEKEQLMAEIDKLRRRIESIEKEMSSIKSSSAYKSVIVIENWDDYFRKRKATLEAERDEIKKQVNS